MYMNVHIDDNDSISELSDKQIRDEYISRKLSKGSEIIIPDKQKIITLRMAAIELRKMGI